MKYLFLFLFQRLITFFYKNDFMKIWPLNKLVVLKVHRKSNLWQFVLEYCRLQDPNLNENVLYQRGLDKRFRENILAKDNFLKLLAKELPHGPLSQTLVICD